ncbi:MAG: CHAT domain-containing protein [Pseudanabaena sp.]
MNPRSRYGLSLSAISLVVCPLLVSVVTLPEVVFGAEVKELRSGLVAQASTARKVEADRLLNQGNQQYLISQFQSAFWSWQQAMTIYREIKSLAIAREIKDRRGEGQSLENLGIAYRNLGKYDKVIEFQLQRLAIAREIKDSFNEIRSLQDLRSAYSALGKFDKVIEFYLQSLAIAREIKDRFYESSLLGHLGNAYYSLRKYDKAIEFHLQSLAISRETKNRFGESHSLGNMGDAYYALREYNKALEFYLQRLAIDREIKQRSSLYDLNSLGSAYKALNRDQEAMTTYQQALTIARETDDRGGEGLSLANLGDVLSKAKRPELAILFYKQSVNIREAIRKDIRKFDKDKNIEKDFLSRVESTYRNLADLLLQQDRILEAQQVLDLLKGEELNQYLKNVRGNDQTAQGVDLQNPEQNIIALGNELAALQQLDQLTPAQKQRLSELTNQEINRNEQFNAFLNTPLIQKQLEELRRIEKAENVDIEKFNRLRSNLRKVKNAVILYPLILEDRLELIIITANTPPIRKTTKIKREQLNTAIAGFLSNLRDPSSANVEKDAQQFYEWIIKPFEAELQQANIQTIIYAPDGQLRYIPLAALHDGKQWLVAKYRINNITASSLTDFTPRDYSELPSVLAAAATNSHNIKLGDRSIPFGALPATKTEVEAIATLLPKTTTLIDQQFSKNVTLQEMKRNTIIHLATHGYFAVGRAEDSFIIFGDGDKATLTDIANWSLTNVSLVVLSACETAIGGKLGSGVEILGLGYRIQDAGAGAAIASLWKVSDDGTSELMQKLYKNLSQKNISSSEALRQAQIAMIRSNKKATSSDRANIRIVGTVPTNQETQLSHPYYWSAFILIGNGF